RTRGGDSPTPARPTGDSPSVTPERTSSPPSITPSSSNPSLNHDSPTEDGVIPQPPSSHNGDIPHNSTLPFTEGLPNGVKSHENFASFEESFNSNQVPTANLLDL
uniref:Uncharacterized protein n=1 Tax=Ciona savignyi TaxID=51511 RepID=H2Y9U4_CIOSA